MSDFDYWHKQGKQDLFPEVDTWQPEQKRFAGKLLVIGGNRGAFFSVANAMQMAQKRGAGEVHVILPKSVRGAVPVLPEIILAEADAMSGAFSTAALSDFVREAAWADAVVIIGDLSKNAMISALLADFLERTEKPVYMMRDAVDAVTADAETWLMREGRTTLFASVPQLQKLLRAVYYPKMITLSMPTNQLVETLHKFTMSYEVAVGTFHNEQIIFAQDGQVVSESLKDTEWTPLNLWDGKLVVDAAILRMWNPTQAELKCLATATNLK